MWFCCRWAREDRRILNCVFTKFSWKMLHILPLKCINYQYEWSQSLTKRSKTSATNLVTPIYNKILRKVNILKVENKIRYISQCSLSLKSLMCYWWYQLQRKVYTDSSCFWFINHSFDLSSIYIVCLSVSETLINTESYARPKSFVMQISKLFPRSSFPKSDRQQWITVYNCSILSQVFIFQIQVCCLFFLLPLCLLM